ncbi:MAG: hypothetical protein ACQESC_03785 [Nanobdellota archaeon]
MRSFKSVRFILLLLVFMLSIIVPAFAEDQRTFVISNSKDWKEIYSSAVYAGLEDADYFYFFTSLSDAELKTSMIAKDDEIIIFEPQNSPVVKNYDSMLEVNGYEFVASMKYDSSEELYETIYDKIDPEGIVVFGTEFGVEPIATFPYLINNNFVPLFYSDQSTDFIHNIVDDSPAMYVGRIPVREFSFDNKETYFGTPIETTFDVMNKSVESSPSKWGLMTRIDVVDFQSLLTGRPVFLHFGTDYLDDLVDITKNSDVSHFEVIGGDMVDIAQEIESRSGEDFKYMLKYGRKVTNYDPLGPDSVLDLDSMDLPRPSEFITIENVTFYENMGILTVDFANKGNLGELVYSTYEFAGSSFSDDSIRYIPDEESLIASYDVDVAEQTPDTLFVTTRFGSSRPLRSVIEKNGSQIIEEDIAVSDYVENTYISIEDLYLDINTGVMTVDVLNNETSSLNSYVSLNINNDSIIRSSKVVSIPPSSKKSITIPFKYTPNNELLNKTVAVSVFYGLDKPLLQNNKTMTVVSLDDSRGITPVFVVIAFVLVAGLLLVILLRKKKNNSRV